jgi:hypothetical protein
VKEGSWTWHIKLFIWDRDAVRCCLCLHKEVGVLGYTVFSMDNTVVPSVLICSYLTGMLYIVYTVSGELQVIKVFLLSGKGISANRSLLKGMPCVMYLAEHWKMLCRSTLKRNPFVMWLCLISRQMRLMIYFNWEWMLFSSECSNDSGILDRGILWSMKECHTRYLVPSTCHYIGRKRKCYVNIFSFQRWGIE